MRQSCKIAKSTLEFLGSQIKAGISTEKINSLCHEYILDHAAIPAPLNYRGFPKSVCTSVNNVICHGIPSTRVILQDGDILNVDVTTIFKGMHGDTSKMFLIGEVSQSNKDLVDFTYRSLRAGIQEVAPGKRFGDIGHAISSMAEEEGYGVVTDFCAHGIGKEFHEEPQISHEASKNTGPKIKEGMTFTIEPMINQADPGTRVLKDGWTAVTIDGKNSAQFEHTVLVTKDGYEILTLREEESR